MHGQFQQESHKPYSWFFYWPARVLFKLVTNLKELSKEAIVNKSRTHAKHLVILLSTQSCIQQLKSHTKSSLTAYFPSDNE